MAASFGDWAVVPDGQSSAVALVETNDQLAASYIYVPDRGTTVNNETGGTTAAGDPFRYRGGYQDATECDGYYHFGARYNDASTARFAQPDPKTGDIGNPVPASGADRWSDRAGPQSRGPGRRILSHATADVADIKRELHLGVLVGGRAETELDGLFACRQFLDVVEKLRQLLADEHSAVVLRTRSVGHATHGAHSSGVHTSHFAGTFAGRRSRGCPANMAAC